jgi:hypothetical protein
VKIHLTRCPDEGSLRAYLDGELDASRRAALDAHLHDCPSCSAAVASLQTQAEFVGSVFSRVPVPEPATRVAWRRFETRRAELDSGSLFWRLEMMWQSLRYRHMGPALAGTILVALLVGVMTVAPLRATAARFLGIFRVQKFAVVQIPAGQPDRLRNFQEQVFGKPEISKSTSTNVESAAQAGKIVDFSVLTPTYLPAAAQSRTKFVVESARTAHTEVDVTAARSLLEAAGLPTDALPKDRTRIPMNASLPPSVMMVYGDDPQAVGVIQGRSPQVDVPNDVDMTRLGEVGLQLLGLPADQARQLSRSIDWATTLVVPVPADVGEVQQITVRDTTGYVLSEKGNSHNQSVVFWESNNILYAVAGQFNATELVKVAESLK